MGSLDTQFHRYLYDTVLGDAVIASITGGDVQENTVIFKEWEGFVKRYLQQQLSSFTTLYENAKTRATGGLRR